MNLRTYQDGYQPLPLPYSTDALEPILSARTISLHQRLYGGYAERLTLAEQALRGAREEADLQHNLNSIAFNGAGYVLHGVYFYNMQPGDTQPGELTRRMIGAQYGSMDDFQRIFLQSAKTIPGPGWMVLGWHPRLRNVVMQAIHRHPDNTITALIPILVLDVWEHAYLLDYEDQKNQYIDAWWTLINWADVDMRLQTAIGFQLQGQKP